MSRRERLARLAAALEAVPVGRLEIVREPGSRAWALAGVRGGPRRLPRSMGEVTEAEALDAAEAWMVPELVKAELVPCPRCDGKGELVGFVDGRRHDGSTFGGLGALPCAPCGATGFVTPAALELMAAGTWIREARRARGLTLRQAATAAGVSIVELSAAERGANRDPVVLERCRAAFGGEA